MDLAAVHTLYEALAGDRFSFLYSGHFHDEHSAHLIALGEELFPDREHDRARRNRLAFVMVEAYQNIVRHRSPLPPGLEHGAGRCLFVVRHTDRGSEVVAYNPVHRSEVAVLLAQLQRIEGMDLAQLKEMFLSRLQSEQRSERGGAGLGLIEMTRRSGNALAHWERTVDAEHVLFALCARLGEFAEATDVASMDRLHEQVAREDIVLLVKGLSSSGVQESVLRIIEKDIGHQPGSTGVRTSAYLAVMEMLQGLDHEALAPLMAMGRQGDLLDMVVGVRVQPETANGIVARVEEVNALDGRALEKRYRDAILGRGDGQEVWIRGLLDLARKCHGPLRVQHGPIGDRQLVLVGGLL